jgi:hypothetical protein
MLIILILVFLIYFYDRWFYDYFLEDINLFKFVLFILLYLYNYDCIHLIVIFGREEIWNIDWNNWYLKGNMFDYIYLFLVLHLAVFCDCFRYFLICSILVVGVDFVVLTYLACGCSPGFMFIFLVCNTSSNDII